ncbi:hypothetical protein BHE74_00025961 [Ensete ventricosum]|uniref:Uncharacterized protein n=1 Tax=Ensete ventricosum TaxID=4639 RepID=A0A426ZIP5_ENSVE|nr:hypothetical protein B296_00037971 [Ensete ventricosum]RWW66672.1 hypothetical protein BHE74_00025961 [Ensete ventricosum]
MYDPCRRFDTESRLLTRLNPTVRTGRHAHRRWSRLVKERTKERRVEHWKTMKLGRSRESVTPSINQVRPGPPADAPTGNAAALAPEPSRPPPPPLLVFSASRETSPSSPEKRPIFPGESPPPRPRRRSPTADFRLRFPREGVREGCSNPNVASLGAVLREGLRHF